MPSREAKKRSRTKEISLRSRIQAIEDRQEIEDLKASYCFSIDNHEWQKVAELFAAEGVIDCGPFGKAKGREEIRRFFENNIANQFSFFMHMVHNPLIVVRGSKASGTWYWSEPSTYASDNSARWIEGRYDEQYVKEGGKWRFQEVLLNVKVNTPFDQGWAKENQS